MTIINGAEYYQPIVSIRAEDDGPVVEYKDSPLISDEFWQALTSWDATRREGFGRTLGRSTGSPRSHRTPRR